MAVADEDLPRLLFLEKIAGRAWIYECRRDANGTAPNLET